MALLAWHTALSSTESSCTGAVSSALKYSAMADAYSLRPYAALPWALSSSASAPALCTAQDPQEDPAHSMSPGKGVPTGCQLAPHRKNCQKEGGAQHWATRGATGEPSPGMPPAHLPQLLLCQRICEGRILLPGAACCHRTLRSGRGPIRCIFEVLLRFLLLPTAPLTLRGSPRTAHGTASEPGGVRGCHLVPLMRSLGLSCMLWLSRRRTPSL